MKSIKLISVLTLILFIFSFAACSNDNKISTPETPSSAQDNKENSSVSSENKNTKYADAKVYEKDGVPYAKTEKGIEVELSGESLMELMAEYEKVKGSESEKERELLDKIQLILEAPKK